MIDFLDAHKRHWQDAELLRSYTRLPNADHLYGMSAECGLKRLMMCFGMPLTPTGGPPPDDKKHIDEVWGRYEGYRSGHVAGPGYSLPSVNPFVDWRTEQRYNHQNGFSSSTVDAHRSGAEAVHQLIEKALRDGLI